MLIPKSAKLFLLYAFEVGIRTNCLPKRILSKNQREENDSQGKNVSLSCIIFILTILRTLMNLGRHIAFCSFKFFESEYVSIFQESRSEAEIIYFENLCFILYKNENVLQFKIAMSDPMRMKIDESLNDIFECPSFDADRRPLSLKIAKQTTFGGIICHHNIVLLKVVSPRSNVLFISKYFYHISVMQVLQNLKLVFEVILFLEVSIANNFENNSVLFQAIGINC